MAELAAIGGALNLLQEALSLAKQACSRASEIFSAISNVKSQINRFTSELNVMQAFLKHIETDNQSNDILAAWTKEVRKVEDQIIDILDEFTYQVNKQKVGSFSVLKRIFKEPMSLAAWKKLSDRLDEVDKSLKHLNEMKYRYSVTNFGNSSTSRKDANAISVQVANSAHFIDEHEIVGIDENRKKLTSLINSEESDRSIITVCGMPGIGKTILVTNVFQRERENFTCQAWVCISQTYEVGQVLRNLISEICKNGRINPINTENKNTEELRKTVRNLLQHGKYLIVLDDVWNKAFYENIGDVFVNNHEGSRIVITSRITNVASLSRENNRLKLDPLSEEESWKLFCRKAFPFERNHQCPPLLYNWAKMIVSKCNGLPLALASLGSVLSSCNKIESEWKRVYDQLPYELENNESLVRLKKVLELSFNYLPDYLKDCFLYCCMFPEDYPLARKKLIRLWIAEDFVESRGGSTLEETAEGYLLELINRNMLQVVEKNDSGRVKRCRMHDTLRELAISLCMKNKFGLLYGDNKPIDMDKSVRRLSIINSGNNIGHYVQLPQLRTLMSFDLSMHLSPLVTTDFVKCRHLTVLNLENLSIRSVPENIGDLYNLRYLGLRNTKVKHLPKSIRKLVKLQTLDLCKSEVTELPDEIIKLTQLRHLFAEAVIDNTYKSFQNRMGIYLPKGMSYLKELQTLQSVESNDMVVGELGNLTQLRSLGIRNVNESHSAELCRPLSKMPFLYSLYIFARNENHILHLNHLNSPSLRKLWLFGQLEYDTLKSSSFQFSGKYIQQLYLGWSELSDDPLPMLAYLENLTSLFLNRAYRGRKLSFYAGWFPRLKKLGLTNMPHLNQVEMKNGTMKSIETIVFQDLKSLIFPQGVEHLSSLKSILCDNLSPDFGVSIGVHKFWHFNCIVYE